MMEDVENTSQNKKKITIIIPMHNEEENIPLVHKALKDIFDIELANYKPEILFVDDGSTDFSVDEVRKIQKFDNTVRLIEFSRNFGKEAATSAGLHKATGDAVIMIDADMQHPPKLIPKFVQRWEENPDTDIVIGVRTKNNKEGTVKKLGSRLFYIIFNRASEHRMEKGETDFRLLDKKVVNEFASLSEHNRMTRSLINWIGFNPEYIEFEASEREHGTASYSPLRLLRLALNSWVAHSTIPLEIIGYIGGFFTITSFFGGLFIFIEHYVLNDILGFNISNIMQLAILLIFLVGLLLVAIGIIGVYIGTINKNATRRPLYIIKKYE